MIGRSLEKVMKFYGLKLGVAASISVFLVACDTKDPGQAEEVMKLREDNRSLTEKLKIAGEQAASNVGQSDGEVARLQSELEAANATLGELKNRFDRKRLEISFASAVSDFKEETLKKYPGTSIKQLTMHEMVMPSDHPFSSGLSMTLRNNDSGESKEVHVKALGNIEGEWSFQKVSAQQLVADGPIQGAPEVAVPPSRPPVTTPVAKPPGTGITRVPTGGGGSPAGKVFRIDWGD